MSIHHAKSVIAELDTLKRYSMIFLKKHTGMLDYQLMQLINKATTIYNVLRDYEKHVKRMMRF